MARDFGATGSGGVRLNFGSAASLDNLLTFTMCVWVYIKGWAAYQHLIAKEQGAPFINQATYLHADNLHSGGLECGIRYGGGFGEANTALADSSLSVNTWYHIGWTFDDSGDKKVRIYVNGVEGSYDHQTAGSGSHNDDSGANLTAYEGNTSGSKFGGYLHDFCIWSGKILTPNEMLFHRLGGNPYPSSQILHVLMLAPGSNNEPDISGSGNHGTVVGVPNGTVASPPGWSLEGYAMPQGRIVSQASAAAATGIPAAAWKRLQFGPNAFGLGSDRALGRI